jgi:transposase
VKGRPCVLMITPGNVHDMKVAKACIAAMPPSAALVGDKGYDSNDLRDWLASRGTMAVIPSMKNRKVQLDCDHAIYKQRNVVERMFCRFKDWRRVATRFDRNIKNFMATIAIAATVIWWLK